MEPKKIAVVGAGISGLSAAWLLSTRHDVTLIEAEPRLGGHSNTVEVSGEHGAVPVDTGFIVFNPVCYPNLVALFDHLGVASTATDMTFAVSRDRGRYEYSGSGLAGLFGQPWNLTRVRHWRMVADLMRFFRDAPALLDTDADGGMTLGAYLAREGYRRGFIDDHILPMAAAIWSTPSAKVLDFPAVAFVRFFANHRLLQAYGRPQWRTVTGGSRVYVARLAEDFRGRTVCGDAAVAVKRAADGVGVRLASGAELAFDDCVLACHADTALSLLQDAEPDERRLLGAFRYASNRAVLHSDPAQMPRRRRLWSSWNYLDHDETDGRALSVTYWMNRLQPLSTRRDWFVTLNPAQEIPAEQMAATFDYAHPIFDAEAMAAQRALWDLQGLRRTWFCGSYFGYGFHEDGLQSGLAVAEHLGGVRRPWTVAGESDRLHLPPRNPMAPPPLEILEAAE